MEAKTALLLLACMSILVPLAIAPVATAEPSGTGDYCVDVKPDDPSDPVDVYDCPPASEP